MISASRFGLGVIALISLFYFSSCATNPIEQQTGVVQRLFTGASWTFIDSSSAGYDTTVITITDKINFNYNGSTKSVFVREEKKNNVLQQKQLVALEDGRFLYSYATIIGNDTLKQRVMWALYPVIEGMSFTEQFYDYDSTAHTFTPGELWTWTCDQLDYSLMTEDGRILPCIVFKASPDASTQHFLFYAVDVGYVGWWTRVNGVYTFKSTIRSYNFQ